MVSPVINMPSSKHSGVSGIPTQLLVLHSAESPLRGGYAQSLTNWANGPGVEASWQWFVDPIAIVQMVDPQYTAWHATWANSLSEGFEQAGYARFSSAEWTTAEGWKQMDNLAWLMAERCKATGIPARWLTTAEVNAVRAGNRSIKGICTHAQVDPAQRTDPGSNYPYDTLMAKIQGYMGGTINTQSTTIEEDEMPFTFDDLKRAATEGALAALEWKVDNSVGRKSSVLDTARYFDERFNQIPGRVLDEQIPRAGEVGGNTSLRGVLAYTDQKHIETLRASVSAAQADGVGVEDIIKAVKETLAAGVRVDATVKVGDQ